MKAVYDYKHDYIVGCVYDCHYVEKKMLNYNYDCDYEALILWLQLVQLPLCFKCLRCITKRKVNNCCEVGS